MSALHTKSFKFSVDILNYVKILRQEREYEIASQLIRCGTSIGANVFESKSAESKKDFISKLSISLKEARETLYWLLLIKETYGYQEKTITQLSNECEELIKLLYTIIKTSKKNLRQ